MSNPAIRAVQAPGPVHACKAWDRTPEGERLICGATGTGSFPRTLAPEFVTCSTCRASLKPATLTELATYARRAEGYRMLATRLRTPAGELHNPVGRNQPVQEAIGDPQVRALALTWANECDQLAKRWAEEREGGL